MGDVASDDNAQNEVLLQQEDLNQVDSLVTPTPPNITPDVAMADLSEIYSSLEDGTSKIFSDHHKSDRHKTENSRCTTLKDSSDTTDISNKDRNPYADFDPNTTLLIPIINPSAFPIQRLQEVQSQRQPSTHIVNMWCHKTPSGPITQITADVQDGSINHLLIRDERWISALGFAAPDYDTINLDATKLYLDETFKIKVFSGQRRNRLDEWVMGELVGARHAYLYWLDERGSADPQNAPFAAEAKAIARKTGRRWPDIMKEVERVWDLEHGGEGKEYRDNRMRYLGEDPVYPVGAEKQSVIRSMFS